MKAKLISMTDFVLEQGNPSNTDSQFADKVMGYANFIKKPLKLEMFVPCDEDGYVLEEPIDSIGGVELYSERYKQAKEKVLFEGFEFFDNHKNCLNNMLGDYGIFKYGDGFGITTHQKGKGYHSYFCTITIEDLIRIEKGISLTPNAIKQLGL